MGFAGGCLTSPKFSSSQRSCLHALPRAAVEAAQANPPQGKAHLQTLLQALALGTRSRLETLTQSHACGKAHSRKLDSSAPPINSQPVSLLSQLQAAARVSVVSLLGVHTFLFWLSHLRPLLEGADPGAPSPACALAPARGYCSRIQSTRGLQNTTERPAQGNQH